MSRWACVCACVAFPVWECQSVCACACARACTSMVFLCIYVWCVRCVCVERERDRESVNVCVSVWMRVCVCVCMCACVCVCVCVAIRKCMNVRFHSKISTIYMNKSRCRPPTLKFICLRACVSVWMCVCERARACVCVCVCTHEQVCVNKMITFSKTCVCLFFWSFSSERLHSNCSKRTVVRNSLHPDNPMQQAKRYQGRQSNTTHSIWAGLNHLPCNSTGCNRVHT